MLVRQAVVTATSDASLESLAGIKPNLVLAFAAPHFFNDPGFAAGLGRAFPDARRVAVSTAGEISSQGVSDHSAVITAIHFDHIPFKVASTEIAGADDAAAAGRRLAEQLVAVDLKAVILLSQGVAVNGSALIDGAVSVLGKHILLTGGLAGDNGAFTRTWAMLDDTVSDKLMLAIGFYGDAVAFSHGSFGGWQSFGPARRATRVNGNVLHELDGEPALTSTSAIWGSMHGISPLPACCFPSPSCPMIAKKQD